MARITLINGYYVDKDPLNYTLKQKYIGTGKDDQPKEMERTIGYFGNITDAVEECIKCICDDETASFDDDIKEYAEVIDIIARNSVSKLQAVLEGM